jgi:hypothetical protein
MLIKYEPKQAHVKCVPLIPVTETQKKYSLTRSQVQLLPGVNEVTDEEWDVMKSHLSRELNRKEISIIEKDLPKNRKNPAGKKVHNLKEMPIDEALNLVQSCLNPDTLTKWHKEEIREEVRLAIVEKMKELKMEIPKYIPGATTDSDQAVELEGMSKDELIVYAGDKDITINPAGTAEEILAEIKKAEQK